MGLKWSRGDALPAMDALAGGPLAGPFGRLLGTHLLPLRAALPALHAAQAQAAADLSVAMPRAAVLGTPAAREMARAPMEAAMRRRVVAMARAGLGSARLTPDWLAAQAGLSRSALYRLFEPEGGVARMIQRERLREARRLLLDPAEPRTVARIAEAVGMPDASVFGRAFRREFGLSPGALRAGEAAPARTGGATLDDVLRRLGG